MSETQQEKAEELAEAFQMFDAWDDRYAFLMDLGRRLPPMPEAEKTEENRILECQNRVWVAAKALPGGIITFDVDSDGAISKGLAAILHRLYSGQPAEDILTFDMNGFLARLGLSENITPQRLRGLDGMVRRIKALATDVSANHAARN